MALLKAKAAFDVTKEWPQHRERYGDSEIGRGCFIARRLIEAGVPFVEVGHDNYDSHADNFVTHKANMNVLDPAWSCLLQDLHDGGLLKDTLVVWMGEVGRSPGINNRDTGAIITSVPGRSSWPAAPRRAASSTAPPTPTARRSRTTQ